MSSKKIWRKSGVKGDKMKVKASRNARKSVRKKERYAREMQRNCHRLAIGEKEKKRVLREGYKGFRRGQGAGRKRVIRMEIQVYRVSLCSWFIIIRLCHTDLSLSSFSVPCRCQICIYFYNRYICIWSNRSISQNNFSHVVFICFRNFFRLVIRLISFRHCLEIDWRQVSISARGGNRA